MAGFKTHITFSSVLGVGYGGAAWWMLGAPWPTCVLGGGLCAVSGMLPDIDSDSGTPLHESMAFAAAVVPMLLLGRFQQWGLTNEMIVLCGAAAYLLVRFGFAALLKRFTVHRGMFHSLPAALVFGEVAFLIASGDVYLRAYKAGGVVLGYLSHLLLDELYSIEWHKGRLRLKSSFGTALKLFGRGWGPNLLVYAGLLLLAAVILFEPQSASSPLKKVDSAAIQQSAGRLIDSLLRR
jgi:membrane-bound metal-dependent hydrolase YbcI (DUF457 family)